MVEYQCYLKECKNLHYHLLNDSVITLDMIPQYVRIVERHYIYLIGIKKTIYRSKKDDNISLLYDFYKLFIDDILSLPNHSFDESFLELHSQMIHILCNTLMRLEYDYGKDVRKNIESSFEPSVLRTLHTYEVYGKQSVIDAAKESFKSK